MMNNTDTLTPSAFNLLQDIFRAYRGEYALDLAGDCFDQDLGVLWDSGLIDAAPIPTAWDRFIPSDQGLDTFEVIDVATGSAYGLEPRHSDRFVIRYRDQLPLPFGKRA